MRSPSATPWPPARTPRRSPPPPSISTPPPSPTAPAMPPTSRSPVSTQSGPQIDTTTPTIASLDRDRLRTGDLNAGDTVTLTLNLNEVVTVAGGTPDAHPQRWRHRHLYGRLRQQCAHLQLHRGGRTEHRVARRHRRQSQFRDHHRRRRQCRQPLALRSRPRAARRSTPQHRPSRRWTESPASGDLNAGNTVTLTLNLNEVVTVAGGTPTLTLNDGGIATYTGGSGSKALTFSYTVAAGQNTASLAATAVNLNSATITDGAGNAANLSLSGLTQSGPQIDTTTPTIASLDRVRLRTGDLNAGDTITLHPQPQRSRHGRRRHARRSLSMTAAPPPIPAAPAAKRSPSATPWLPARTPRRSPPPPSISTPQPSPTAPAMPPTSRSPVSPRAARRSTPQHRPSRRLTESPCERRPQCRRHRHPHPQSQRGRHRCRRHAHAHAQ